MCSEKSSIVARPRGTRSTAAWRPRAPRPGGEAEVVAVGGGATRAEPRRPSQMPLAPETDTGHLVTGQHELKFPVELETHVVAHPVHHPHDAGPVGQQVAEAIEIH